MNKKKLVRLFIGLAFIALVFIIISIVQNRPSHQTRRAAQVQIRKQNVVLCLGDSFTYGNGAPKGFSYSDYLQKLFEQNSRLKDFLVINKGASGQNTAELLIALNTLIKEYQPEFIVLQTGSSNFWNNYGYGIYVKRSMKQVAKTDKKAKNINFSRMVPKSEDEILNWIEFDIREMIRLTKAKNVKVIVQNYPLADLSAHPTMIEFLTKVNLRLAKIAGETGVLFIDQEQTFKELQPPDDPYYYFNNAKDSIGHCNARGYKAMADGIYGKINEKIILAYNGQKITEKNAFSDKNALADSNDFYDSAFK